MTGAVKSTFTASGSEEVQSLAQLVRRHAVDSPDRPAVISHDRQLTYSQLDKDVNSLVCLLSREGVGRGSLVVIYMDRTHLAVVALLAVGGRGAAFCLVEPNESDAVDVSRMSEVAPDFIITTDKYSYGMRHTAIKTLTLTGDEVPDDQQQASFVDVKEKDAAYVVYTSGSSGAPKGAVISFGNISHYTSALSRRLDITAPLRFAHVTTLTADLGHTSLFLALSTGGTFDLVSESLRRDPAGLLRHLQRGDVHVLKTTPSHWQAVSEVYGLDDQTRPQLRILILGGELLTSSLARQVLASGVTHNLVNHYGPTETTVGVTTHAVPKDGPATEGASVPIGTPLGANRVFAKTKDGHFRQTAASGELYIAGPSVGMGYRNDPAATERSFIGNLSVAGVDYGRAYRTGDQVNIDAQGVVEFLGRRDRQVKIRGHRVDLGYIEGRLRLLFGVRDVVLVPLDSPRPSLVAALLVSSVPTDSHDQVRQLRLVAARTVPSHMLPDRLELFDHFPCTRNGKVDVRALESSLRERSASMGASSLLAEEQVELVEMHSVWERQLGRADFDLDTGFAAAGGNSMDVIQVIADLQLRGYSVTTDTFTMHVSVRELVDRLKRGRDSVRILEQPIHSDKSASTTDVMAPAQGWFFRQEFDQPDRWNQAFVFELQGQPDISTLTAAVDDVVAAHPALRTSYDGRGLHVLEKEPGDLRLFTVREYHTEATMAAQVRAAVAELQSDLSISTGEVFRALLIRHPDTPHLVLLAHHLSVDLVSWRLILQDLDRFYGARLQGASTNPARGSGRFTDWVRYLDDHSSDLESDLRTWSPQARGSHAIEVDQQRTGEVEATAASVWFTLSKRATDALASGTTTEQTALLGAFAYAWAALRSSSRVSVDVESHGRATLPGAPDISRTVGWFTSTYPVDVPIAEGDARATIDMVGAFMSRIPNLGLAYGLHLRPQMSEVSFNYLASVAPTGLHNLRLSLARLSSGPLRGATNHRPYLATLTAKRYAGQLVVDLSYSSPSVSRTDAEAVARVMQAALADLTGKRHSDEQLLFQDETTGGQLGYVPSGLSLEGMSEGKRQYGAVLLTGATGFVGQHLLRVLLTDTDWTIYCLVRSVAGGTVEERLEAAYEWYWPSEDYSAVRQRIRVIPGDVRLPRLGMVPSDYSEVQDNVAAIYHLASDTRLLGATADFRDTNVSAVEQVVRLAQEGKIKDVHHVSTLAVSGVAPTEGKVVFSEVEADYGQAFLSEYEHSKLLAEEVVRGFTDQGGDAFIYRLGNISGDSVSGRFQRNASDNRIIQLLQACAILGRVPDIGSTSLVLTPADTVSSALLAVSQAEEVRGGTFHLDAVGGINVRDIFQVLRELGVTLDVDASATFTELLDKHLGSRDRRISTAHFWASRPPRNVQFDHSHTERLLSRLGAVITTPSNAWLRRLLAGLIEEGHLGAATPSPRDLAILSGRS